MGWFAAKELTYELESKLLKGGYIGDYMGDCQNYGPFLGP